jgi:two-component system nitrogen regulation response regulator GlnG
MGKQVRSVTPEAMALLEAYGWPGNVRELQSAVKSALIHATGEFLTPDCLPADLRPGASVKRNPPAVEEALDVVQLARDLIRAEEPGLYDKLIARVDRAVLAEVLRQVRGNQVRASEVLGIARNTLRSKLRAAGLAVEKQVGSDPDQGGQ